MDRDLILYVEDCKNFYYTIYAEASKLINLLIIFHGSPPGLTKREENNSRHGNRYFEICGKLRVFGYN